MKFSLAFFLHNFINKINKMTYLLIYSFSRRNVSVKKNHLSRQKYDDK